MKKLLVSMFVVLGLLFSNGASAKDRVVETGGMTITLTDKPCKNAEVLKHSNRINMDKPTKAKLKAGKVEWQGQKAGLCYLENPADKTQLFIIDAKGDMGYIQTEQKKAKPNVNVI